MATIYGLLEAQGFNLKIEVLNATQKRWSWFLIDFCALWKTIGLQMSQGIERARQS